MTDRTGIFAGDDPFAIFGEWFEEASAAELNDPNAMTLATVDADGMPDARIVLLKAVEDGTLQFFTNYESRKGEQLIAGKKAALNFHWKSLGRQVRFRGNVVKTGTKISDEYYATRPLGSRVGAWASRQSRPLSNKEELIDRVAELEGTLGASPSRPPHWGGFQLAPTEIEFWCNGDFRLHDRFRWTRDFGDDTWRIARLNP